MRTSGRVLSLRRLGWFVALVLVAVSLVLLRAAKMGEAILEDNEAQEKALDALFRKAYRLLPKDHRQAILDWYKGDLKGTVDISLYDQDVEVIETGSLVFEGCSPRVITIAAPGAWDQYDVPGLLVRYEGTSLGSVQAPRVVGKGGRAVDMRMVSIPGQHGTLADNLTRGDSPNLRGPLSAEIDSGWRAAFVDDGSPRPARFAVFVPTPAYQLHMFSEAGWSASVALWKHEPREAALRIFYSDGVVEELSVQPEKLGGQGTETPRRRKLVGDG